MPYDELAIKEGYYFDETEPLKVKKFLETYCIQSKAPWAGKPLTLLPWQYEDLIKPLYGWRRPDGTLRYKRAGIWIPKKQGKSTLLSGLCLYHLVKDAGSFVACLAADKEQASIVYKEAAAMCELSPALNKRLWVRRNIKEIEDTKNKSNFRVMSSEPHGKSGFNCSFLCLDELADWPKSTARDVWDQLANATAARKNALQVVISTAQYDKTSLGYEQYRYAKAVKEESLSTPDLTFLPLIFEVSDGVDWRDENNWWAANPSAGVTVPKDDWRDDYKRVCNSPVEQNRFRTLRLNQWVGNIESFIPSEKWESCYEDFEEQDLYGSDCFLGVDYARRYDLCAYCLIIPKGDNVYVLPRFFIPRDFAVKKEKIDGVPYLRSWYQDKKAKLFLTPGDVVDPSVLREQIKIDSKNFRINQIAFDPYGFEESRQFLENDGFDLVEIPQRPSTISPALAHFERLITTGRLRHNGNPILTWNVGNCSVRTLGGSDEIMLDKRKSTARIDGVMATVIGITRILEQEKYYDSPILVF